MLGNGLLLLAAACWAVSIVYVRAHRWISTPFQLVFWEALLASGLLGLLALLFDGVPRVEWTPRLVLLLLYGGVCGNALAYWAHSDPLFFFSTLGLLEGQGMKHDSFIEACERVNVPVQQYAHRNDMICGSTIGPITAARLGISTVDVGAAT